MPTIRDAILSSFFKTQKSIHIYKQIHSLLITGGFSQDTFLLAKFLDSLISFPGGGFSYASNIFDRICAPNIYLWNTMIRGLGTSFEPCFSLVYYAKMRRHCCVPDKHTFPLLLKVFSKLSNENPFQFYAQIVKFGLDFDDFVRNSLISALANCGYLEAARQVFGDRSQNDVIAWTALIDGYVRNDRPGEGLKCLAEMRLAGVRVDEVIVVSVLSAGKMVGDVWIGRAIHGLYIESGRVCWDVYVGSALLDMYSKCGYCDDARKVFDIMPSRNVVSWSALISGYVDCNRFKDGLAVFQEMLSVNCKPNQFTLTSVLAACAKIGALDLGRWVHGYIGKYLVDTDLNLETALIDMYAKCGCIDEALTVFEKLPLNNAYPWTAIINGFAMHGDALGSLNLFLRMLSNGVQPNEVTFIGVLSACSHGGLVDQGCNLFESMRHVYHIEPNVDHYGCMVDLLGRAGYLEEARKLIEGMPMEPTPGVWGALFGACMIHKAFDMGEQIGNHLINLQPNHSGRYMLLGNLYSTCQNWEAVAHIRKLMKDRKVRKLVGHSWIEMNGVIHEFIAIDKTRPDTNVVYEMLENVTIQLKHVGI